MTLTDLQEAEKTIGRSRPTWPREEEKEEKEKQDKEKQEEKKETETKEDDYRSRYRSFEEVRGNSFLFPVKENRAVCGILTSILVFFVTNVSFFFSGPPEVPEQLLGLYHHGLLHPAFLV